MATFPQGHIVSSTKEKTHTLRRNLSLRDLVVYGMLFIGITAPMGTFGVLDARSGGVTPLVFIIAACAMGTSAYSYARMSYAIPQAGSVYAYTKEELGKKSAFFAGWMLSLDYIFIPAMAILFMGIAFHALIPALPVWVFTIAGVIAITVLNIMGVKMAANVGTVMMVIELIALTVFVVASCIVLIHHGPERAWWSPFLGVGHLDFSSVFAAATVAALAFLGFDAIASFAEETTGSPDQVGRALKVCLIMATILFVIQTYLASLLEPSTPQELANNPQLQGTAFYDLIHDEIGSWMSFPVTLMRAIGPIFSALVAQAAASRLLFGMARGHQMPQFFARIDPKEGVPTNAIGAIAVLTFIISTLAALRSDGLEILSSLVTVGALSAFVFLHIATIKYDVGKKIWWRVIIPALGIIIVLILLINASRLALTLAGIWALCALMMMGFSSWRGRRADTGTKTH